MSSPAARFELGKVSGLLASLVSSPAARFEFTRFARELKVTPCGRELACGSVRVLGFESRVSNYQVV